MNLSSLDELNSVWAMILHKGHGKDREKDRSYRTISTCPLLAKSLDKYVGSLYETGWMESQAETQFQGPGSSHELAALLLSECVQHSLFLKKPLFVILLDAKSAFDKILREIVIKKAYLAGSQDQGLLFLDNRLKSRLTILEWDKTLMGPIDDALGVEQGGINSDRLYKLANNDELKVTQSSGLGLDLGGGLHVASIGQADDVAIISDDINRLQCLLHLVMDYAESNFVEMVPEKTKLMCYVPKGQELFSYYWAAAHPISLSGHSIPFTDSAEHVGIIRSTAPGNMVNVLARQSAHTRAIYGLQSLGLARHHRGSPAASLRLEKVFGAPVLLSGLAALILNKAELLSLDHHYKVSLERLQRLYPATPRSVVHFLAGSLPASAILHIKQFTILGMISRLGPNNILYRHGMNALTSFNPNKKSWFSQIRCLATQYALPDPVTFLQSPPAKEAYKLLIKKNVLDWWQKKLRAEAIPLSSLFLFKANFMSLSKTHPIWTSAGVSPFEVEKATVQMRMLSGRYRTCWLRRHWSGDQTGSCQIPGCSNTPGTLLHIATAQCPSLAAARAKAIKSWTDFLFVIHLLLPLINNIGLNENFLSFLVDPTTYPGAISLAQENKDIDVMGKLCYLTRTWLFLMHKERLTLLDLWNKK